MSADVDTSESIHQTQVLVVGAGLVGVSIAIGCLRMGLSVILVDSNPFVEKIWHSSNSPMAHGADSATATDEASQPIFCSRVSAVSPRSQRFLNQLNVWQNMPNEKISVYDAMEVWDAEGTGRVSFHAKDIHHDQLGSIIENPILLEVMLSELRVCSLQESQSFHFIFDSVCDYFAESWATDQSDDTLSRISLSKGGHVDAQLVIGADGSNSTLRELAAISTREWDYGHHAIVTTIKTQHSHQWTAWQRFLSDGPLALLPLPGHDQKYCSIVWSVESDKAQALYRLEDSDFLKQLQAASEQCLGEITWVDRRHIFPLRQCHAKHYVRSRLALVGDAAHNIHPLAGQGVNLGFSDAHCLLGELRRALDKKLPLGDVKVLQRYERQRQGENLKMMGVMETLKRTFQSDDLFIRWARNTGMRWVNQLDIVKRFFIHQAV